jgi:hypothetical protein
VPSRFVILLIVVACSCCAFADEQPAAPYGPRMDDAWHDDFSRRVDRLIKSADIGAQRRAADRVTLISSEKTARVYGRVVSETLRLIHERFGPPLSDALDPRSAYVVLLDSDEDYEKWLAVLFGDDEAYRKFKSEPREDGRQDPLKLATGATTYFTPTICTTNVDAFRGRESVGRRLAYQIGYMAYTQATEGRGSRAVQLGFANVAEALLFHEPSIRTYAYEKAERGRNPDSWAATVRLHARAGKLSSIHAVLDDKPATMSGIEYQQAWSLTDFLSRDKAAFGKLIEATREGREQAEAIGRLYARDSVDAERRWRQFIFEPEDR